MPLMVAVMARLRSGGCFASAFAAEELDLDEREGVDVGVAEADGLREDGVGLEELALAGDEEEHAAGEVELGSRGCGRRGRGGWGLRRARRRGGRCRSRLWRGRARRCG